MWTLRELSGCMSSLRAHVLLNGLPGEYGSLSVCDVLVHLAAQVADRVDASHVSLVARPTPTPVLAALGSLDDGQVEALQGLSGRINALLSRTRHISYYQVERDCNVLAQNLLDRVGRKDIEAAQFVGIPRGGLIALGMLSYVLDLDHSQLKRPPSDDGPLVVVDDCALTGSRFRRFLRVLSDREIVFAPLYAHPNLCEAIEHEESRVAACVNARDLHDYAPEELGDDYAEWQARWHDRHPDARYWIGRTEHLCFPWGEADTATWNPEREQVEHGLSVVPPEHRLKTRPGGIDEVQRTASRSVQVQPAPAGPIRPTSPVLFGTVGEETVVAHLETDRCLALDGTAAAMWHALVEHGTVNDTIEALRETYSVDASTLRVDLIGFIEQLAAHNLLHVPDGSLA